MAQIYVPGACSLAMRCKDGVVLANDTRVIWGYTVNNKNVSKIFPLVDDKKIAMTCYGLTGDFQALARIMLAQSNIYNLREGVKISLQAMSKMVANYLYNRKQAPLYANVIIAGVDKEGPRVFTTDALGSLMEDDFGVAGSGATFAVGILEAEYNPDMTVKQGIKLAEKTVRNAIKRDAMTGNGIDIMAITMDKVEEIRISLDSEQLGE